MILLGTQAFAAENQVDIEEPAVIETVADAFKNGKRFTQIRWATQRQ